MPVNFNSIQWILDYYINYFRENSEFLNIQRNNIKTKGEISTGRSILVSIRETNAKFIIDNTANYSNMMENNNWKEKGYDLALTINVNSKQSITDKAVELSNLSNHVLYLLNTLQKETSVIYNAENIKAWFSIRGFSNDEIFDLDENMFPTTNLIIVIRILGLWNWCE